MSDVSIYDSSPDKLSRINELRAAIKDISDALKRPGIRFAERLMLNEDRKDLRAALSALLPTGGQHE